jgi:hypothetical protein
MQTPLKTYKVDGRALLSHALQGMKPHHAAARWNFASFQSSTYSAVLMEYTTPQSYGKTVVGIGGIATDGDIICAGTATAKHLAAKQESENEWPEPRTIEWDWKGERTESLSLPKSPAS